MSDEPNTKVCPHCAETVKSAARVCPHCRRWQRTWSLQNPSVLGALGLAIMVLVLSVTVFVLEKSFEPKHRFVEYRDQISVLSFQVNQRPSASNLLVTVAGTLTNGSEIGWKDVGVEAQFLDKSGKVFDAITVNADDYHGVTILPHDVAAFKLEGRAAAPTAAYDDCKVFVRWAKDVDAWP